MSETSPAARPAAGSLVALVALGMLSALWSLFLWMELVVSRSGAPPFCALGEAGQCSALWDGSFSRAVHAWTGLPVAAWGVGWGLVAALLPLFALARLAEARGAAALVTATRMTAAGGVVAICVLGAVALAARGFCGSCFVNYLLVAGYAGIALFGWQHLGLPEPRRGAALAAAALLGSVALLLYPGLRTPKSAAEVGRQAIAERPSGVLGEFVVSLAPGMRQTLADSLLQYRDGIAHALPPPRTLLGASGAPLRITEFTDVLCDHCAQLHESLAQLKQAAPADSFSIEPRQFPLDAACNPAVERSGSPVRCAAAKAQICLEGHEKLFEYSGALFAHQKTLQPADVLALAEPYVARAKLQACIDSPETSAKLQDDIQLALRYQLDGTPLVLLNGRKAAAFPPFLYAMAFTAGAPDHPAFASLPAGDPNAHIH